MIGFNVPLFNQLVSALGIENVVLCFDTQNKAIFVRGFEEREGYGILMPRRLNEEAFTIPEEEKQFITGLSEDALTT